MQAYQQYIDDILGAVYSPETADPDFLRDSAAMYAEACAEVNDRLRKVGRLLHRGLRSEAIQLAEEDPNLLDMVAMLDVQELPAWRQMLVSWGMAEPPQLLIDLAADLNKAYADQQPLESLLRQHRILALARAPLATRIQTLRLIRNADKVNDAWGADIALLERARLKQISMEADNAKRTRDVATLTRLSDELRTNGWSVDRPTALVERVEGMRAQIAAVSARQALVQLDEELNAAHMAFDLSAARAVRQRWLEAAATAALDSNDPLAQRASPALEWLDEQDRQDGARMKFFAAAAALEHAVDDGIPPTELERLYRATQLFDEPLSEKLRRRVEQKLADHDLNSRRKRRLIFASLAIVLCLAVAGVVYQISEQAFVKSVNDASTTLGQFVDDHDYVQAERFFDNLLNASPKVAVSGPVQQEKTRLDRAVAAEKSRAEQFAAAFDRAKAAPVHEPDRKALADSKRLAKTDDEKAAIAAIEQKAAEAARRNQQEQDKALSQHLVILQDKLTRIDSNRELKDLERLPLLEELRSEVAAAKQRFAQSSSAAMTAQLDALLVRIDTISLAVTARQKEVAARSRITEAVGSFDEFTAAINEFSDSFPETSLSGNAETIASELNLWQGLLAWSDFALTTLSSKWPTTAADARAAIQTGDALEAAHAAIPLVSFYRECKPYFESIAAREPETGDPPLGDVKQLLRDPLISRLWLIIDKNDSRFYSRNEPVESGENYTFKYVAGFDLSEKPYVIRKDYIVFRGVAPQSAFAEAAVASINGLPQKGWESSFREILYDLDGRQDIDPILKLILLQRILDAATGGSAVLNAGFEEYRKALSNANVDLSVPWMAPRDDAAAKERARAEVLLTGLPQMEEAMVTAASQLKILRRPKDGRYSWIAWLDRDETGVWQLSSTNKDYSNGDLCVICKDSGDEGARVEVIGDVESGKPRLSSGPSTIFVEGRPVFLRTLELQSQK